MAEHVPIEGIISTRDGSGTALGREHRVVFTLPWERLALGSIVLVSLALETFRLNSEGYANTYYAAAVKSMIENWHNFFFVSFDPGGFVSVDKPPVDLWLQVLSAKVFGFSGVSILLPQALATVLSVFVLYHLVQRVWGAVPALVAALTLAVMPVSVATGRNNTMDSLLVLVVLLAAWAASRAAETGRLRWIVLTAVLMGIGFNVKMLEAYLVLPALDLLYLLAAPHRWTVRLAHLVLATVILLVVSLSWAAAVDLTPASQRPYVGSSSNNTELNLILGYNGLNRFQQGLYSRGRSLGGGGRFLGGFGRRGGERPFSPSATGTVSNPVANGWFFGTGQPGLTRLLNQDLAGQVGWLLPLAFVGLLIAAWQTRRNWPLDVRQQSLVLWGMWLVTQFVYFSIASRFQSYYLVMLAPSIAALMGIGATALWRDYRGPRHVWWLLPLTLIGVAAFEASILAPFVGWSTQLGPVLLGLTVIAAAVLIALHVRKSIAVRAPLAAAVVGVLTLLVAPTVWAAIPVWNGSSSRPVAGPGARGSGYRTDGTQVDTRLLAFLRTNTRGTRFLLAMPSAMEAAPYILATGKPVMALGGFSGADAILTPTHLAALIHSGAVRYFLLAGEVSARRLASLFSMRQTDHRSGSFPSNQPGVGSTRGTPGNPVFRWGGVSRGGFDFFGSRGQSAVTRWVIGHCAKVHPSLWRGNARLPAGADRAAGYFARFATQQLYDC